MARPWVLLRRADLFEYLPSLAEHSIDAAILDPPYGLGFMGKKWDTFSSQAAADRIKASKHNLDNPNVRGRERSPATSPSAVEYDRSLRGQRAFQDWSMQWARKVFRVLKPGAHLVVCGAPRSAHRMISGIEDAGFEIRDCLMWMFGQGFPKSKNLKGEWEGWGTALKPGWEPIVLARKPLSERTLEANVEKWGTGALNIDACRLAVDPLVDDPRLGGKGSWGTANMAKNTYEGGYSGKRVGSSEGGRWPANLLHDGSDDVTSGLGLASRFFYCAKTSKADRDDGCAHLPPRLAGAMTDRQEGTAGLKSPRAGAGRTSGARNFHPTVKPTKLMRWLVRLVTPPGGIVLDCFMGSGSTGRAAVLEGHSFIGCDFDAEYLPIAKARIAAARRKG